MKLTCFLTQHWGLGKGPHEAGTCSSVHEAKFFIILFERAFKMMKNGVYFIVIALLVAELFKILIYAN